MRNTWDDIAMPILRTLQEMETEEGGSGIGPYIQQMAKRLGMDENEIGPQLDSLEYDGYISVASNTPTMGHAHRHFGIRLLPNGRRVLGEWPADPVAALASALARALEEAGAESGSAEERVGAGNSAVVVDLRRCGPILGHRVPNLVPIPSPRMEPETPGQRPRPNYGHPQDHFRAGLADAFGH